MTKCTYCDDEATGYTLPPMCEAHEEIAMLIEYLQEMDTTITNKTLIDLAKQCRERNGKLVLTDEEILTMYPRMIDAEAITYKGVTPR